MNKKLISLALSLSMLGMSIPYFTTAQAAEPIIAFPGAEGAGKYATGGRGGTVYHVTNLNDSGTGSFRDAVSRGNRIVVFDVGGTIELKSDVSVAGNITIAGQTAPGGGGITLRGGKIGMAGDNIIIRFISSRPGENGSSECDAWGGSKGSNSMIDHCSIGWANDEQFGLYSATQQTIQYSLIGPANCISYHSKGAHGFGVMMGAGHNTWHHNMIAHNISRNYRGKVSGTNTLDYVNNVIFNWGYQTAYGTFGHVNYVGNYFKKGLSTNGGYRYISISSGTAPEKYRFYLTGNKMVNADGTDHNSAMNSDNWQGVDYGSAGYTQSHYQITSPVRVNDVNGNDASVVANAQTADEAFETVLAYAGAGIRADLRPEIDRQVMDEARTGNGYLTGGRDFSTLTSSDTALNEAIEKYNIKEMNYDEYYPIPITQKEIIDSDNDGMSDDWELARGLDPYTNDATLDYLGQGYNNIEYYINDLTVDSFPEGVVTLSPETVDLGEDFEKAKADADAITISTTFVKTPEDLILPTQSANGSVITWSSTSSEIIIENNQIVSVNRPSSVSAVVTLSAGITYGEYTLKRAFSITVPPLPYKFDFGNGSVQSGFTAVSASTTYSPETGYGFVGTAPSDMVRAPENIPSGYENMHEDQIFGETQFKAEIPNGKYIVVIHYGSWNTNFGTNYTVEGINSGNLSATAATEYVTAVEITDGILDLTIAKGSNSYGGYINGLEILPPPDPQYHFDFGDGTIQDGYVGVSASTVYSPATCYGFADAAAQTSMERAPANIPSGYENLHADQISGITSFKSDLPNGKYIVTIHYGSWNTGFGTSYNIEGVESGNLASTDAAQYIAKVEVTDGMLDVAINTGGNKYGGYINGIDIMPLPTLPYHFDFGDGAVQTDYFSVTSSTIYSSDTEFGFVDSAVQEGMARAPGNIASGFEDLYNDQILGETQFKADIPNGKYDVIIHYGSWNTGFGVNYTIEGVSSGNLTSTDATQYRTTVDVTDEMLDVSIGKGSKQYGGYISGMDVIPIESTPEPTPTPIPTIAPTTAPTAPPVPVPITYSDNAVTVTLSKVNQAILIHSVYESGKLISVEIIPLEFENGTATVLKADINIGDKLMVWDNINDMKPLSKPYVKH